MRRPFAGEIAVLAALRGDEPAAVPEQLRPLICWKAEQLGAPHERLIAQWPRTWTLRMRGLMAVRVQFSPGGKEPDLGTAVALFDTPLGAAAQLADYRHQRMA